MEGNHLPGHGSADVGGERVEAGLGIRRSLRI